MAERPAPARKVTVANLTMGQIELVELSIGCRMSDWSTHPSESALFTAILAAVDGQDRSAYAGMTLDQFRARVDLSGDDDPDA